MKILLFVAILFLSVVGRADNNIVQLTVDGVSTNDVPEKARVDSLQDGLNQGSLQIIQNLIGQAKLDKNMPAIKAKVLTQTSKFVQFYKAAEPVKKGEQTVTSITMKISVTSLRDLLAQENLLYQNDGPATILPVISLIEKKDNGRRLNWWTDEVGASNGFLKDQEKMVFKIFDSALRPKNFFFMDPLASHFVQWVPQGHRNENPSLDDLLWMGDFFKAQMVLAGDATLEPGANPGSIKLAARLIAYHSSNGRVVAEVTRSFEMPSHDWDLGVQQILRKGFTDIAKDLSAQILDESSKGTLGATLLHITVRGSYSYSDLENFKKQIIAKMGDVKTIKERLQEKGATRFDIDYSGGLASLVKALETNTFDGFKLAVSVDGQSGVEVHFTKTGEK